MGLKNISPETIQRLRSLEQSEKFQTLEPNTQKRISELSMQFDAEGNKKFITREDRFLEDPSLGSLAKTGLLQIPILGSALSSPTERNINPFGIAGRMMSGASNVQKDILEREMKPIEIREPAGPIAKFFTPARALGASMADSMGAIGRSYAEGFDAPRGAVKSPLGTQARTERPISDFFSEEALKGLEEGKGLGILTTALKATANDVAGVINDVALDAGMNAMWFGTVPAMRAAAVRFMHLPIGQSLAKVVKFVDALGKTQVGKGYAQRFVWEMNQSMRKMAGQGLAQGATRAMKKYPDATSIELNPQYKEFLAKIFPEQVPPAQPLQIGMGGTAALPAPSAPVAQAPLQGPLQAFGAASEPVGGQIPPFDQVAASQAISQLGKQAPVGAGTGVPTGPVAAGAPTPEPTTPGVKKQVPPNLGISQGTFDEFTTIMKDVPPEIVKIVHKTSTIRQESFGKTVTDLINAVKKDIADPNYNKPTPKEMLPQMLKDLQKMKKANDLLEQTKPKTPLQKGIEKPLTKEQIEEAKGMAEDLGKNMQKDLAAAAKRNKRSIKQEIAAQKKALQKDIAEGEGGPFEKNVKRRMLIKLEELEGLIAKREGKKIPIPKKSKPKTSISKDTIIKGDKPFKLTDLAGEKKPPVPAKKPKISKTDVIRRAKNVLKRFENLPEGENKKALKGIPARLAEIIKRGEGTPKDLEMIDRFMKFVEAEEAAIPKKPLSPLEEGIKKTQKKFSLADIGKEPPVTKGKGVGQFTVTNNGKVVGNPMPTLKGAQAMAAEFNKKFNTTNFDARELTADEIAVKKKKAPAKKQKAKVKAKKEAPVEKTPLEEGIEGKKPVSPLENLSKLEGFEPLKGKKMTKDIIASVEKYLKAEKHKMSVTKFDKGKIIPSAARNLAVQQEGFALDDLVGQVQIDMNVDEPIAIKIINKILNFMRNLGEEGSIFPQKGKRGKKIDVGPMFKKLSKKFKKLRARRIKKLKRGREVAFAAALKGDIKTILKAAKAEGQTVEEFILANKKAFPGAPKDLSSLQNSIKDVLSKVPVEVEKLAKGDIVTEAGQPGIVEGVGDTIKIRFQDGLSEMSKTKAGKVLKQTGRALQLSKMKGKKLPASLKKILARNPKHVRLAELANASIEAALKNPKDPLVQAQATQMTQRLINALVGKTIDINNIPEIVKHYAMSSPDFIKMLVQDLRTMSTEAGQVLNLLSQNSKKLVKILKASGADPKEIDLLFGAIPKKSPVARAWSTIWGKLNRMDQFTKGFLTAAFKTSARNAEVQGVISLTNFMEDLAVGVYQKLTGTGITGKEFVTVKAYRHAVKSSFLDVIQFAKNLAKLKFGKNAKVVRRRIIRLLDQFPIEKANLLRAPIQDVFIRSKIIETLNAVNILQENFFRTMLTQKQAADFAAKHGTTIHDIAFWRQNSEMMASFVEKSLLDTFSSNLKNVKPLGSIVQFFVENPILASLAGNPFVRFAMNNYFMILGRRSPLQLANLLGPEFRSALRGPNNAANLKTLAQGLTGLIAFSIAAAIRSTDMAGPKWYQIDVTPWNKKDNKFLDTRPFAPLPQYLFMVELAKSLMGTSKSTLTATDFFQGILSVSRVAGTGLVFADFLRSEPFKEKMDPDASRESRERLIKSWLGQYLSRPTVPLKQFQDIIGLFDPKENEYKFIGDDPLMGPTLNNLPWAKRLLPELREKGRVRPRSKGRIEGLIEFGTGLRLQRINVFEQEMARLGLSGLHPGTGNPGINQRVLEEVQPGLAQYGALLMETPAYQQGDDTVRTDMISEWVSRAFKVGRDNVKVFDDRAAKYYTRKDMNRLNREINREIASDLLDLYLEISGDAEDEIFSKSMQGLLRSGEAFSQPNAK